MNLLEHTSFSYKLEFTINSNPGLLSVEAQWYSGWACWTFNWRVIVGLRLGWSLFYCLVCLLHNVLLHPHVEMVTGDILLGVTLQWTSIPPRGSSNTPSCFVRQVSGYVLAVRYT